MPISLGAALIASSNPIPGLWYVTALGLNWTLGVVSYLVLPALGPVFVAPDFYANLPETGTAALQQALIYERHEALAGQAAQSIAAFASLHVSVVFTAALIAQLLHLNRYLRDRAVDVPRPDLRSRRSTSAGTTWSTTSPASASA